MNEAKDRLARLADEVRRACLKAALDAYEDGGLQGLCEQGRWELAVQRLRSVELGEIVRGWEEAEGAAHGLAGEEAT